MANIEIEIRLGEIKSTFSSLYLFKYDLNIKTTTNETNRINAQRDPFSSLFINGNNIHLLDQSEKPPKVHAFEICGNCKKTNCQNII